MSKDAILHPVLLDTVIRCSLDFLSRPLSDV